MKITFLFGNGFDRRMGLKTGYDEIEAAYCASPSANKNLSDFKSELKLNSELWSDFENGMGEHTALFTEDQQAAYSERIRDFSGFLINYLMAEEKNVNYEKNGSEISKNFKRFIERFGDGLERRYYTPIMRQIEQIEETVYYHFVSFNYTHVLDECLEVTFKDSSNLGSHVYKGTRYHHNVDKKVMHVHGELPGPIVMGVNDKTQIANEAWANSTRFCERYVKPATNHRRGSMVDDDVVNLLNQSSIICIFGMSLGKTDAMWWKIIADVLASGNKKLIIYGRQKDLEKHRAMPGDFFDFEDDLRDKFLDVAEVKAELRQQLSQKIYAIRNTNHLSFQLISEEKEQSA